MKKITLLLLGFFLVNFVFAQEAPTEPVSLEISFESSENFTLGDLHSQNGWTTTGCGAGCNIENQVISADDSTDGDWALKLTTEGAFAGQANPIVGGFYNIGETVSRDGMTFSYDFKISDDFDGDGNDYRFTMIGPNPNQNNDLFLGFILDFRFDGTIRVVNNDGNFENLTSTWEEDIWYNIRVETTSTQITYFIDDVSVATFNLLTEVDYTTFRFVHDNFGGEAFVDNIKLNMTEDTGCDHDQLWLVGAGVTQAGWGWDTPVALPCTGDNVYSGVVEFTPLSDGNDGNFRFFTVEGDWGSGLNFPYFVTEGFTIDDNFGDAEDNDNNFLFTGEQGEYLLTVDFTNNIITLEDGNFSNVDFSQINFDFFVNQNGLNLSASEIISTVEIYNLSGKRVVSDRLNQLNGSINIDQLSKGIYLAKVQIGKITKTVKFVK